MDSSSCTVYSAMEFATGLANHGKSGKVLNLRVKRYVRLGTTRKVLEAVCQPSACPGILSVMLLSARACEDAGSRPRGGRS